MLYSSVSSVCGAGSMLVLHNAYEAILLGLVFQCGISLITVGSGIKGSRLLSKQLFGAASILALSESSTEYFEKFRNWTNTMRSME